MTDVAERALKGRELLIARFPFRVGGAPAGINGSLASLFRRLAGSHPVSDLLLSHNGSSEHVSARHLMLEAEGGRYFVTDLDSRSGTIVDGITLGRNGAGKRTELQDHAVIIIGTARSPLVFKFRMAVP